MDHSNMKHWQFPMVSQTLIEFSLIGNEHMRINLPVYELPKQSLRVQLFSRLCTEALVANSSKFIFQ